jgi:hypothetical protein
MCSLVGLGELRGWDDRNASELLRTLDNALQLAQVPPKPVAIEHDADLGCPG